MFNDLSKLDYSSISYSCQKYGQSKINFQTMFVV